MFATHCPRCGARIELHSSRPSSRLSRLAACRLTQTQVNAIVAAAEHSEGRGRSLELTSAHADNLRSQRRRVARGGHVHVIGA